MRVLWKHLCFALIASATPAVAKSTWSFEDASVSVQGKGVGVDGSFKKERFAIDTPLSVPLTLGPTDTLKVVLTTTEDKQGKRPHQAFLMLKDTSTGLEDAYVFSVKENGKGKVEVTQKDLPFQLLAVDTPLKASLVVASFGSSTPLNIDVFDLVINQDPTTAPKLSNKPIRYGKLEEIHHIFRPDPTSPPKVISIIFAVAVLITLPALLGVWLGLGANLSHVGEALSNSPLSHAAFFGSIIGLESIFFMYYTSWNLFQMLPAALSVGVITFLSGSRALSEVQERRLAGKR